MTAPASSAITDLRVSAGWDFGGYAYGLEPLTLPTVGLPYDTCDVSTDLGPVSAYDEICEYIRMLGKQGDAAPAPQRSDVEEEELFWFRWITGHQTCFAIWRLLRQLWDDAKRGRAGAILEPMSSLVYGYSAMLLYTGSCPREIYSLVIRPSMRLRHRGFSGSWAPDYVPIRDLFRGRRTSLMSSPGADKLQHAILVHSLVHDGVAAKLVPDGRSLLRQAAVRRLDLSVAGVIYDSYFMTLRAPVTRHEVVAQLLRRVVAIVLDLTANGLHTDESSNEWPAEVRVSDVVKCEASLVDILSEVARCVCGLMAKEPTEPLLHAIDSTERRRDP